MNEYAPPAVTGKKWAPLTFPEGAFPAAVKLLRTKAGLTQVEAAAPLDVQPMTISTWERGAQMPHPLMQDGAIARLRKLASRKRPPAS